jgi:hypothetical protein
MQENYKFKDILFGLYKEYITIQEQLDSLQKYLLLQGGNIETARFYLNNGTNRDTVVMICTLYEKKNELDKIFDNIRIRFGIFPSYENLQVKKINETYELEKYPEIVDPSKKDKFDKTINNIVNNDYISNMETLHYNKNNYIYISTNDIYMHLNRVGILEFRTSNDSYLHASSLKGAINNETITRMLNTNFPKEIFPEYYQSLIENSENYMKNIQIIGNFGYSKKSKLEVYEDSKKLVLIKR